jgi:flagellar protein FliO/FliZ
VVEIASVDAKRKLVLVRRDATEHLVLLGPTSDLIVERAIGASAEGSGK